MPSSNPPRSPLNFEVTCLDDLLIWADLWLDYNEPLYAAACRWAHKNKRWPRKYRASVKHPHQYKWNVYRKASDNYFTADKQIQRPADTNFPCFISSNTARCYASVTLAYLDLFSHMVMSPEVFLKELESPSP